jgi:hypothetical protein
VVCGKKRLRYTPVGGRREKKGKGTSRIAARWAEQQEIIAIFRRVQGPRGAGSRAVEYDYNTERLETRENGQRMTRSSTDAECV